MYFKSTYSSPVGCLTIACDNLKKNLTGLWMDGQKYHGNTLFDSMKENDSIPLFDAVKRWLDRYFSGKRPDIRELPLSPGGSDFRQSVWDILCEIPYGEITTYGKIATTMAKKMGKKTMSSQAVGGAVGHNPISIIIPCHRVVGGGGSLTGYAGGIDIKIKLLELEGVDTSKLSIPKKGTAL